MVLNRKTNRRRRLMVDSNSIVGESVPATTTKKKRSANEESIQTDVRKAYAVGAMRRHQRKVTDLIPKRPLAYSLSVFAFLVLIASVNLLAHFSSSWHSVIGQQGVQALAITGPNSLSTYLSTVFFAVAAALCLQIYALRQHRCDDYEGTYRVWGWLAPVFVIASLACVLPLGAMSQNIFTAVSGRGFSVTWLPLAIGVGLVSSLLVRYLMEVRYSYGTAAWSCLAWFAICASWAMPEILAGLDLNVDRQAVQNLALGNGILIAAASSLLANLTYARFVFLRSNGFIHAQPKQVKAKSTLPFRPFRERTNARRDRKASATVTKETMAVDAPPKSKPVKTQAKKSTTRKAAAKSTTASKPKATKTSKAAKSAVVAKAPVKSQPVPETPALKVAAVDEPAKQVSVSASEKLRQLAAATRVQKTTDQTDDQSHPNGKPMSKAQRRKLRKQQKQQKRAA